MAPPGNHHYFYPLGMGAAQSRQIHRRDLKLGIQQGAINIEGK
jgi:hypothetical protein